MPRKIEFKEPGNQLKVGNQVFHQGNITPELYDMLVEMAPSHADFFNVIDTEEKKTKGDKKPD